MKTQIKMKCLVKIGLSLAILLLIFPVKSSYSQCGWNIIRTDTLVGWHWNFFTSSNTGYTVGAKVISGTFYPRIIKTTNSGSNWFEQMTPLRDSANLVVRCVFFVNANTGFVTYSNSTNSNYGGILKTTDGGNNWIKFPLSSAMTMLYFINSSTGFSSGYRSIFKTTNAGVSWELKYQVENIYLFAIRFTDINTGYVVGNYGTIIKTTNSGENWAFLNSTTIKNLWGLDFKDANTGFAVGDNDITNIILKTTNAGDSWNAVPFSDTTAWFWSVRFISQSTGYITGWNSTILKTTNGGLSWYRQFPNVPVSGDYVIRSCFFTSADTGYTAGHRVAPSEYSYILKTTTGGEPLGINPISNEVPEQFQLHQNYPNPFNPVTKITFDLPKSGDVRMVIFDILGREVATIVNQQLKAGTYQVDWDASSYASGVYYYKLQTDDYMETKKMLMIK